MSDSAAPLKTTALHQEHSKAGAKLVDFGGWEMPVQYIGIIKEHQAVRNDVGIFDISHMGQFLVSGDESEAALNAILTNDLTELSNGEGQYTFMLNPEGGVIDDLFVYRLAQNSYLLVVNASKVEEDFAWLRSHLSDSIPLVNRSTDSVGIAIQGPNSEEKLKSLLNLQEFPQRNEIVEFAPDSYLSRTGYTGEDGFEIFLPKEDGFHLWQQAITRGITPCGLGARDTLRLEVCYPLNGSDLSPTHTPLEAGLAFAVDLGKHDFIGKSKLVEQRTDGLTRKLIAFKTTGKSAPPRSHYPILVDGQEVGETTSGSLSPSLGCGIGMAYLPIEYSRPGTNIEINIRGRHIAASIVKKPLYKRQAS